MNNFLEGLRLKLRIPTTLGPLSLEQACELKVDYLEASLIEMDKKINNGKPSASLSFINKTNVVSKKDQLCFDILKEIYLTKKEEEEAAAEAKTKKEHNKKIMALIHEKQEKSLGDKSIEELTAMLK